MRQHPDEGTLQAYLDGEIVSEPREALDRHLEGCVECRARLRELDRLAGQAARALRWTGHPPDMERARAAVRRNRESGPRRRLAAAASVVLLVSAGAAAAMPGSPVRGWVEGLFGSDASEPTPTVAERESNDDVAIEVPVVDGTVQVAVVGAGAGSVLVVELADDPPSLVRAPAGARFESAEGRVRVDLSGNTGEVHVTVSSTASPAVVEVDGSVLLRSGADGVAFPTRAPDSTEDASYRFELEPSAGTEDPPEG